MKTNTGLKNIFFIAAVILAFALMWSFIGKASFINVEKEKEEKGMDFKAVTTNLMVKSVNENIKFYNDVFGFEVVMTVPDSGEYNFAMINRGGVNLMLQKTESLKEDLPGFQGDEIGGSFTLFFQVTAVEELYQKAKEHCKVIVELHETFYGMNEFTVLDMNGYYLTFAEEIEK